MVERRGDEGRYPFHGAFLSRRLLCCPGLWSPCVDKRDADELGRFKVRGREKYPGQKHPFFPHAGDEINLRSQWIWDGSPSGRRNSWSRPCQSARRTDVNPKTEVWEGDVLRTSPAPSAVDLDTDK